MIDSHCGVILSRPKGLVIHWGVVTECGRVFHNTPDRGEHEVTFSEFAAGERVTIQGRAPDLAAFLRRLCIRRQRPRAYNAISNNCEHTVSALIQEESQSPQLAAVLLGLGFGVAVGTLLLRTARQ